jgi:hypothetical protein
MPYLDPSIGCESASIPSQPRIHPSHPSVCIMSPVLFHAEFDATDSSFENGVFFGPVAHLTFKGPCQLEGVGGCLDTCHASEDCGMLLHVQLLLMSMIDVSSGCNAHVLMPAETPDL